MQLAFLSEERDYTDQNVLGSCKWCMSTHFIFPSEGDCVTAAGHVSVNNRSQYLNTLQHPQENKKSLGLLTVGLCVALLSQVSPAGGGVQGCGHTTLCRAVWGCRQGSWGGEEVSGWCPSWQPAEESQIYSFHKVLCYVDTWLWSCKYQVGQMNMLMSHGHISISTTPAALWHPLLLFIGRGQGEPDMVHLSHPPWRYLTEE